MFGKKTSLLSKLKNIFIRARRRFSWRGQIKMDVSALDACGIQDDVYAHTQNIKHSIYTPPYMELAAQLLVPEQQIFEAAVTHLIATAKSRPKYASEIKCIFAEVISDHKLSQEKIEYLTRKVNEI